MADAPRVQELLDELFDRQLTPEEVCGECAELLPVVRERWRQICRVRDEFDALFPTGPHGSLPTMPREELPFPAVPGYEVEAVLGRGGMGVVFRARQICLGRLVALKMALAGAYASPQERERFRREAEAVAALRHPNIVQIYDVGDTGGRPYFTMEYVEGGTLAQKAAGTPVPARDAASLVSELAGAVEAAHRAGIVHRDLKPANVLLQRKTTADHAAHTGQESSYSPLVPPVLSAVDFSPKIVDFGLARRLDHEGRLTRTGAALGTPSYMAPEQAQGKGGTVGPAADVYALGAILYELLTGRPPFRAETAEETIHQVITQDPVPPARLNRTVPRDLETVCLKCLQKEPPKRYASAAALAEDLDRFLRGEAIAARPEGRLRRLARRVRRRPALSAALAVAVLSTVALAGGATWVLSAREAAARAADADLTEMEEHLQASAWPEATAALERAKGRLRDQGSGDLRRRVDQGASEIKLAARLEKIRLSRSDSIQMSMWFASPGDSAEAFREAGLGQPYDDPEAVASRVRATNIAAALVDGLDHWSACTKSDPRYQSWVLSVARRADSDPTGWRGRARDPALRADQKALAEVVRAIPVADEPVPLLLALESQLAFDRQVRLPFLKRIQQAHPGDFWANLTLGKVLRDSRQAAEAIRYFQAGVGIRPGASVGYFELGFTLAMTGRWEEAVEQFRRAVAIEPTSSFAQVWLALGLASLGRREDAIEQLQVAIRFNPGETSLHTLLANNLEAQGRYLEALPHHRQAVELSPKNRDAQRQLRAVLVRLGRGEEARQAWQATLRADPPGYDAWYGYAEFCLFLGREGDYRRAREELLTKFGDDPDAFIAARTARACLLLPATRHELRRATALAERAVAADRSRYAKVYLHFLFTQGLADYRRGLFDRATSTLRGDAAHVLGPAPRLVLAMAQHKSGQAAEARTTLAAAILSHDWGASRVRDQDDWICHALRREAEGLILPKLPAFLDGKYEPRENDERVAFLGACQFAHRTRTAAALFADVFTAAPGLAEGSRTTAAGYAALAGSGRGADVAGLSDADRARWRKQARDWLTADLAEWTKVFNRGAASGRAEVREALRGWRADPHLAGLRELAELDKLPVEERREWLALWAEVDALRSRADGP